MDTDRLRKMLVAHEGLRLAPYRDSVGKLTIGVGRNLDDVGISQAEAMLLLTDDIEGIVADLERQAWFARLDGVRQIALVDMAFNLGLPRLLGFKRMVAALETGAWEQAAAEMLDSRWARQVGSRADELAQMMREGDGNELE
ncbi:MAG: hypothetical protein R8J85_07480 [Mariprofundales bacterium]